ncbi:WG repeat-containing protein [Flavobacterium sp. N1719]|uniref:WG repeat-containing protein n=1 Tax=Flavobacterium sp. N1719 TaxID=2885633 RepID=UPI0022218B33|nr:WG repeat-containing protein [Flavobacterium sp. N1719]
MKYTKYIVLILSITISTKLISQNLKTNLINIAIPCKYDSVRDFKNGFARVKLNGKWGFIDKNGNQITKFNFDNYPTNFSDDLCRIYENNNYNIVYFINNKGEKVSPNYSYASDYHKGFACVEYGNWRGLIDVFGNKKVACNCKNAVFNNGLMNIKELTNKIRKYKSYFIDISGKVVLNLNDSDFALTEYFENGFAIVSENYFYGIIDTSGREILSKKYMRITPSKSGMYLLFDDETNFSYFNIEEKKLLNPKFDYAYDFYDGLALVGIKDKFGYIDKYGNFIINAQYSKAGFFSEGLAPVKINGKWGFIDKKGQVVIKPIYSNTDIGWDEEPMPFNEGLARVAINGKWGFINKNGKNITPLKYDWVSIFSNGYAVVSINGKCGYVDSSGVEIIPCTYDMAYKFVDGMARINSNGKEGFLAIK